MAELERHSFTSSLRKLSRYNVSINVGLRFSAAPERVALVARQKDKAREMGWTPEQTLRKFLRKEIAIAGVPAAAIPLLRDQLQAADGE